MPSRGDTQINTFVGGLITEASPLSFPPNSSIDEVNFKLKRDGSRERRLGLDYEVDYALVATGLTATELQVYRQRYFHWPTPNGNTDIDIGIAHIGGLLFFMDMFTTNPSANLLNGGAAYDTGLTGNVIINFTIINNKVAVVSSGLDTPFLLSYNKDTDTVSAITAQLQIRDLYGVTDGLTVDNRPTTLSAAHEYNLRNQGWDDGIVTVTGTEVLQDTFNSLGVYPSNSDTWSLGKIADVTDADVDKYEPQTLSKNSFDIGRAARGHFIIELYNRGASRTTESGISVPSSDRELGRISTVESYAGRLFYSGITSRTTGSDELSPNLSGAVLYSQIARSDADLVKCYQDADPTSPTSNDQVDTDGGVIQVAGAVDIVKLMTVKTSLFVFASNGVWQIRGDESGFRPTSFQVNKISSIGVFSPESIVEANGTIFFWAKSGIYSLTPNQVDSTTFDTTNITISTIQRGYNSLPDLVKQASKGYYDLNENTIRWLYKSDVADTLIVPDPGPDIFQIGEAATVATGFLEPKVTMLSSTTAVVAYRNAAATAMNARVITLNADFSLTLGAENAVIPSSTALGGHSLVRLSATKVLLTYAQNTNCVSRVLNISGTTITAGTAYTVNTVHAASAYTSPIRSVLLDSGDVLIGFPNTTSATASLQVLQISASDVVTFGTVYSTADTNLRKVTIAMRSATAGVLCADTTSGSRNILKTFSISGTTVTIDAATNTFLNATQMTGAGGYTNTTSTVIASSGSSTIHVVTVAGQSTPSVSSAIFSYTGTVSGSTITSTEVLKQTTELGTVPTTNLVNGKAVTVYRKIDGANFIGRVLKNNIGSSIPTTVLQSNLGSDVTFAFPEFASMGGDKIMVVYETATEIKAIAGNII